MWRPGICRGALLVTLAPGVILAGAVAPGLDDRAAAEPATAAPARVHCPRPRSLRLRRFEDRSAQILCGRLVLVRITVPG